MKNFIVTITLFLILVLLLTSFIFLVQGDQRGQQEYETISEDISQREAPKKGGIQKNKPEIKAEFRTEVTSATIVGVGDILMSISVIRDAQKNDGTHDFNPMFEHVSPYISQADIAFANQETILGGKELGLSGYPRFNSPYEVGETLINTGFDVVSIANNHTLDSGEKAILNAIDYYNSTNLKYVGGYESEKDQATIRTIEKNGITFSFLAYSYGTNGLPVPSGKDYLINLIDVEKINNEIVKAKEISDIVVLSLHFGNEYELLPNETQKMFVREFANTGADIIFGHHPHVLQPMEWIDREDGKQTFVAYSLGNFLSGQVGIEREIGGIVEIEVEKTVKGEDVSVLLKNPKFLPIFTFKDHWRNYKIYPLHKIDDDKILQNANQHLQAIKEHVSQWMPELEFELN